MSQVTKLKMPLPKPVPAASATLELSDAVTWLSEHLGYPAPSRQDYETRHGLRRRP